MSEIQLKSATATAPSNIALIKYMGKTSNHDGTNRPVNSSLSLTLSGFRSHVRVSEIEKERGAIDWAPFRKAGLQAPELSERGREKFFQHAVRCFERLGSGLPQRGILIESANDFPSDCGLASSASSFAALTLAIATFLGLDVEERSVRSKLSALSREGSGSSCRSFFSPWSVWNEEGASRGEGLPGSNLLTHVALVVDDSKKRVSSSEAHQRVSTSLLMRGRPERAETRLNLLLDCLKRSLGTDGQTSWNRAAQLVWAESWDMHALFETSDPAFGYFAPESLRVLNLVRDMNEAALSRDASFRFPLVTMDAGPNVHLIFWKSEQASLYIDDLRTKVRSFARMIEGALI